MLANKVAAIAGGFLPEDSGRYAAKTVVTGNPVRPDVIDAAGRPYAPSGAEDPFHLVVFGGSQGAQFFSSAVPSAICLLDDDLRKRLRVVQQARAEDRDAVVSSFERLGMAAEISPFFADMPAKIAAANLVISRSGASTVSELAVIGRPSVLVPYPYALDHDQAANAAALKARGGAEVIPQAALSPEKLSKIIRMAMAEPDRLAGIAAAARQTGKPDAAKALADLVEAIAAGQTSIGLVHFIGIGGIGMSGIAEVLHNLGHRVQGSDQADSANVQRLRAKGIEVHIGHNADNLGEAEVVVVSTAI
eukprot:gene8795-11895_t